jgi:hypothetical protein
VFATCNQYAVWPAVCLNRGALGLPIRTDFGDLGIFVMVVANVLICLIGYRQRQDKVHRQGCGTGGHRRRQLLDQRVAQI